MTWNILEVLGKKYRFSTTGTGKSVWCQIEPEIDRWYFVKQDVIYVDQIEEIERLKTLNV